MPLILDIFFVFVVTRVITIWFLALFLVFVNMTIFVFVCVTDTRAIVFAPFAISVIFLFAMILSIFSVFTNFCVFFGSTFFVRIFDVLFNVFLDVFFAVFVAVFVDVFFAVFVDVFIAVFVGVFV